MGNFAKYSTPVVANGKVYVSMDATSTGATGDDGARLFALEVKTGKPAWQVVLPAEVSSRVVPAKGNVYLGQWQRTDAPKRAASVVAYEG
jgi:outer membrane protein assembly factor BamB